MYAITSSIKIKRPINEIYALLKNIHEFPKFMKAVKRIKILKNSKNRLITRWIINVDGATVMWRERDIFDDKKKQLRFNMLKGDYNKYNGKWTLRNSANCTEVLLSANIDWGVRQFVSFKEMKTTLHQKTRKMLRGMLIALKKKAERMSNA